MAVGEGGVLKTGCFYQLRYVLGEGCSFHAVMDSFSQVEGLNMAGKSVIDFFLRVRSWDIIISFHGYPEESYSLNLSP